MVAVETLIVRPPEDEVAKDWVATVAPLRDVTPRPLLPASVPQKNCPVLVE